MSETSHPPRHAWAAAGALLALLGGLGVALSAAGVVGCWVVHRSLTRSASRACERTEQLLAVTADRLRAVQAGLENAQGDLDALREGARGPAPREPKKRRARQALQRQAAGRLSPRLQGAQGTMTTVSEAVVVLNALLEQLAEVPHARVPQLDADRVRQTSERLTELGASASRLSLLLEKSSEDGEEAEAVEQAGRMKGAVSQAVTVVEGLTDRVAEAQARVAELRSRLPGQLTAAATLTTALLVWAGAGQLCLLARGWSWLRGSRSPQAPTPGRP